MAQINIPFNNKDYLVDESSLSASKTALRNHLSTVMNGSGASVSFDGITYNIDSTKFSTARNAFITHLGTIAGSGYKIVVGGVEYRIDPAKVAGAVAALEAVLGSLNSSNGIFLKSSDGYMLQDINGVYITTKEEK